MKVPFRQIVGAGHRRTEKFCLVPGLSEFVLGSLPRVFHQDLVLCFPGRCPRFAVWVEFGSSDLVFG